jgi:hypothetical protein
MQTSYIEYLIVLDQYHDLLGLLNGKLRSIQTSPTLFLMKVYRLP